MDESKNGDTGAQPAQGASERRVSHRISLTDVDHFHVAVHAGQESFVAYVRDVSFHGVRLQLTGEETIVTPEGGDLSVTIGNYGQALHTTCRLARRDGDILVLQFPWQDPSADIPASWIRMYRQLREDVCSQTQNPVQRAA